MSKSCLIASQFRIPLFLVKEIQIDLYAQVGIFLVCSTDNLVLIEISDRLSRVTFVIPTMYSRHSTAKTGICHISIKQSEV